MLVLSLLLAHLIADFLTQTDRIAKGKATRKIIFFEHLAHHAGTLLILWLILYQIHSPSTAGSMILAGCLVIASHGGIDWLKIFLDNKLQKPTLPSLIRRRNIALFLGDQTLHIASIFVFSRYVLHVDIDALFHNLLVKFHIISGQTFTMTPVDRFLLLGVMLVLATKASGVFIQLLVEPIPKSEYIREGKYVVETETNSTDDRTILDELEKPAPLLLKADATFTLKTENTFHWVSETSDSRARTIGYLERLIVMILTFTTQYGAIAFIITAKTFSRFKQFDHKDYAEYFMVGTLSSVLFGIASGYILKLFWH